MKKQTTTRCLLSLGLVLLVYVIDIDAGKSAHDPFYWRMRKELGLFNEIQQYKGIYREWVLKVLSKNDISFSDLDFNSDWRAYRPTGEMCYDFLDSFIVAEYKLEKPFDIIPLDACLGWLTDTSAEAQMDINRLNRGLKTNLKRMAKNPKLMKIFKETSFQEGKLSESIQTSIREYLQKLLQVHVDHPDNGCHSLWLATYDDFIEDEYVQGCEDDDECAYFGEMGAELDPYIHLIVESTINASKHCYSVLQTELVELMTDAYKQDSFAGMISKKIKATTNRVAKQSDKHKWGLQLIRILQLASGISADRPINLPDVVKALNDLKINDETTVKRFTDGLGHYAVDLVDLKKSKNDPDGRKRYAYTMADLCSNYIDKNELLSLVGGATEYDEAAGEKKPFEFSHIINSIIRMTNHESIYGISKEQFEKDVIANGWTALYLATFACQMISFTLGKVNKDGLRKTITVRMRPNSMVLIADWPIEVMSEQLQPNEESIEIDGGQETEPFYDPKPQYEVPAPVRAQPAVKPSPISGTKFTFRNPLIHLKGGDSSKAAIPASNLKDDDIVQSSSIAESPKLGAFRGLTRSPGVDLRI